MSQPWNAAPSRGPAPSRRSGGAGRIALALIGGLVAAVIAGVIWGYVVKITENEIGYVAVGVGVLVGVTMGFLGRSRSIGLAVAAALLAVLGCMIGRLAAIALVGVAPVTGLSDVEALIRMTQFPQDSLTLLRASFTESTSQPMDLLFIALAAFAGFSATQRIGAHFADDSGPAPVPQGASNPGMGGSPGTPGPSRPGDPYPASPYAQPQQGGSYAQPDRQPAPPAPPGYGQQPATSDEQPGYNEPDHRQRF